MATLELRNKFEVKRGTVRIRYALIVSGIIHIETHALSAYPWVLLL